jgi:hypothetical protein
MFNLEEQQLPTTTKELVEYLDTVYPDKIVTAEQSPYEQGLQHGVINLIRMLKYNLEIEEGE